MSIALPQENTHRSYVKFRWGKHTGINAVEHIDASEEEVIDSLAYLLEAKYGNTFAKLKIFKVVGTEAVEVKIKL